MTNTSDFFTGKSPSTRLLPILVPAAILFGLYGRFKGIGTWPLGVDEFYISRSIDHILASGLPRFPCGGYYTRGLLFQYLVAALRLSGQSPEFAGRLVASVSSLLMLPAAYLLGKRVQGPLTGWLAVILLLVSIWEIEMARFGRMYAPFQAEFVWYLLFYLRYTVDKNAAALRWMIALSIVGVLTWEGGTLLGVANLFAVLQAHDHGRLKAADWRRLVGLVGVLALLYLASRDLRDLGASVAAPEASAAADTSEPSAHIAFMSIFKLPGWWITIFLIPLAFAIPTARFIGSYRDRLLTFAGLWLIVLAAVGHAFTAVMSLLVLMQLTELIDWRELVFGRGRVFTLMLLALLLSWLAYNQFSGGQSPQALFSFPDIWQRIVRPWGRTMPILTVTILIAASYWFCKLLTDRDQIAKPIASLFNLLFLLIVTVAAIPTNRIETRYTFFLYPLMIVIALAAVLEVLRLIGMHKKVPAALLTGVPLLCFAATEDFRIKDVVHVDSAAVNFRVGMPDARADHYYPRNDVRGVGLWLSTHVQPGDVVVSGIPNVDQYYDGFDYFYLDEEDNRYDAYVCADDRTERWSNHQVLYKPVALESIAASGHRVYAILYGDVEQRLKSDVQIRGLNFTRVYTAIDGNTDIVSVTEPPKTPVIN